MNKTGLLHEGIFSCGSPFRIRWDFYGREHLWRCSGYPQKNRTRRNRVLSMREFGVPTRRRTGRQSPLRGDVSHEYHVDEAI